MTHKYERQCWYCKSKNLEKLANYVKCRDCNATFNVVPKIGASPVTERRDLALGAFGEEHVETPSPSGQLSRATTRARSKKEP